MGWMEKGNEDNDASVFKKKKETDRVSFFAYRESPNWNLLRNDAEESEATRFDFNRDHQ